MVPLLITSIGLHIFKIYEKQKEAQAGFFAVASKFVDSAAHFVKTFAFIFARSCGFNCNLVGKQIQLGLQVIFFIGFFVDSNHLRLPGTLRSAACMRPKDFFPPPVLFWPNVPPFSIRFVDPSSAE